VKVFRTVENFWQHPPFGKRDSICGYFTRADYDQLLRSASKRRVASIDPKQGVDAFV
jgi:hypothetical protein